MERTDEVGAAMLQQAWGKLVRVGPLTESVLTLLLVNKECTVGRRKGCDLSFPASRLVSGDHCRITRDQESGQVWLEDTSTNGTVINMSKLVKKQRHLLQNGDVIYFVYRKNEPEQNIAYVYHSIAHTHSDRLDLQDSEDLTSVELMERVDPDVDPAPVEPVTLPSVPQEVQLRPGFQESQPSTSYSIATPTTHTHTLTGTVFSEVRSVQCSVKRPDGGSETDECVQPDRKRQKTDDQYSVYPAVCVRGAPAAPHKSVKDGADGNTTDKMEESLTCIICQDLLYDCVSLQPCMHTFCAACYSGWMERSSLCPTCRCPVERIRKNHILNNLVEAYLLQHPEKCRSEEDLRSMDARNKITQDMLQPKVERYFSDEEGSSDYLFELSDNDSDTSDLSQPYMTCRQCPGYKKDFSPAPWICGTASEAAQTLGDGPSTSSDTSTGLVCQRPFCHVYWGCQRVGCQGCLARFTDLNLSEKCLDGVLNNNHYESEILQNYLSSRGKTWKDMLQEALQSTQEGLYHLTDYRINGNSFLCYCCGLRFFKELAYAYRANIPAAELPVTERPDCYWGRNCRTQIKAHHAMKFNHICEQTRFKN